MSAYHIMISDWTPYGRHTPMFDLNGKTVTARLVGLHDSDTCRVVFDTSEGVRQFIVRVQGIDGPEMNSKDPEERTHAIQARNEFLEVAAPGIFQRHPEYSQKQIVDLLNKHVTLLTLHLGLMDKYGRVLATVISAQGVDIGQRLIQTGSVHAYFGKTKEPWHWLE